MGNYRFRLSDMIPNAWFYKLRDMNKPRNQNISHPIKKKHLPTSKPPPSPPKKDLRRHSYYFTTDLNRDGFYNSPINSKASDTHFADAPRKSRRRSKRRSRRSSKLVTSSVSAGCSCRTTYDSVWESDTVSEFPDSSESPPFRNPVNDASKPVPDPFEGISSFSSSCSCRVSSSATDIIIDVESQKNFNRKLNKCSFDPISELELPPILTKPAKFNDLDPIEQTEIEPIRRRETNSHVPLSVKLVKEGSIRNLKDEKSPARKSTSQTSQGLKIRSNSPRLASRKLQACNRKSPSMTTGSKTRRRSVSESFAIVKSSFNPQRDFRDSMVEMIVENNIRASKDLEELLACYLSLNSDEYHDVIVQVFKQVWFDLTGIRM